MAGQPLESLDQLVDVETPEQVVFSYTVAGIGSRAAAALIDYLICFGLLLVLLFAASPFIGRKTAVPWVLALLVIAAFTIFFGYYVIFEGLWDGQTPGKRQLGLRVVRDGGYSITFPASAIRNLVRLADMQPGAAYGVGILSVVLSSTGKRLGDYAAGTMVVRERAVMAMGTAVGGTSAPPSPADTAIPTAALSDEEYALLDRFLGRRSMLREDRRVELTHQLVVRFHDRAAGLTGTDTAILLQLHEQERSARARGASGRSDTGAAREQHAIVAQGSPRWHEFARLLAGAQRRGLAHMSESEVSDFAARYRELAGDLARLRTASRDKQIDSVFYLSRLVAGGHNLLYRDRRVTAASIWDFFTIEVPREIRRSAVPIGIAALLLFGPAAIAWVGVVRDPALAAELLPAGMLERAEQGVDRAKREEGYIPDPKEMRPVMAAFIMTNNVYVSAQAFAGGMLLGVGTVWALVANGVAIGAALGLYQSKGILKLILSFVAPHGVLELSAIAIAGGGGLLLGAALLLPGARTRRQALITNGRRAIRLLAGTTLLLVVAGTLEGLVSPIPWWTFGQKLSVAALTALLLVLYVNMDRGRQPAAVSAVTGWRRAASGETANASATAPRPADQTAAT